jgi:hypothetical protein
VAVDATTRAAFAMLPESARTELLELPSVRQRGLPDASQAFRLTYNPRKAPTFMVTDATPNAMATVGASTVHLSADGATAWFPTVNLFGDRAATTEA